MNIITTEIAWAPPKTIKALATTRLGGASRQRWRFANFGLQAGEAAEHTAANRAALTERLGDIPVQWLQQVHGNRCVELRQLEAAPSADAAYSDRYQLALGVLTADCLPVFLAAAGEIAIAHCGWRSLAAGLLANTLAHFRATTSAIHAGFGPSICASCYEVGPELRAEFIAQRQALAEHFKPSARAQHYHADLVAIARWQLQALGLQPDNIGARAACNRCKPELYYSHRRGERGRMANVVFQLPSHPNPAFN